MDDNIVCSVIIPAYNAEKTILNCLNSFDLHEINKHHFEIIVVNDGSSDNTSNLVKNFFQKIKNCIVIDKENGGVSSARNIGLKNATGKYIFFCDADDKVIQSNLFKMIEYAEQFDCDVLIAKYKTKNTKGYKEDHLPSYQLLDKKGIEDLILSRYIIGEGISSIWNKLFRRDIIVKYKIEFDEQRTLGEDWAFNLVFFDKAKSVYVINEIVYIYSLDNQQGDLNKYSKGLAYSLIDNYKKINELIDRNEKYKRNSSEFINETKNFIRFCIGYLELSSVEKKEKITFLKNEYVIKALNILYELQIGDLANWTRRNHFAIWLLKHYHYRILITLHYRFKIKMIPD